MNSFILGQAQRGCLVQAFWPVIHSRREGMSLLAVWLDWSVSVHAGIGYDLIQCWSRRSPAAIRYAPHSLSAPRSHGTTKQFLLSDTLQQIALLSDYTSVADWIVEPNITKESSSFYICRENLNCSLKDWSALVQGLVPGLVCYMFPNQWKPNLCTNNPISQ